MRPETVSRMIEQRRTPRPRIGIVTGFDASTVTVTFGGDPTPGLLRNHDYEPVVGDRVVVIPADTTWVVVCSAGRAATLPAPITVRVATTSALVKGRRIDTGAWYFDMHVDPFGPYFQGRGPAFGGWEPERYDDYATVLQHGPLSGRIPTGSTVHTVSVLVQRDPNDGGPRLIHPRLFAHAHHGTVPKGDPGWLRGPVIYPPVGPGETMRLMLPSEWVIAWLAGEIAGIGFFADRVADYMAWFAPADGDLDLEITYTPPS